MLKLYAIPSRSDNYIWALANPGNKKVLIIDPGESQPVINWLAQNNYETSDIFITHHHHDHIDGLPELIKHYNPRIYAPEQDAITGTTHALNGGESIYLEALDLHFGVLAIPGHTQHHLAYYAKPYLFCGDTLFSVGCGRLLGGSIEELHQSLELLKQLPDETLVCSAHEYTLNNIHFAKSIEPGNQNLFAYEKKVQALRNEDKPSLPTLLKTEKAVNPFLRTDLPEIQTILAKITGKPITSSFAAIKAMRQMKDNF